MLVFHCLLLHLSTHPYYLVIFFKNQIGFLYDTETIIDEKTRYLSIPGIGLFDIFERAIFIGSGENLNSANLENTDLSDLDLSEADLQQFSGK
ncbi:pentapeptide repeat-containing protein [Nostoc sp.]|uniref:pentapeptide repeat-containing protein n=1 Tax=Nostoc sp. TaxID=1180 RepID=UPI002FFA8B9A